MNDDEIPNELRACKCKLREHADRIAQDLIVPLMDAGCDHPGIDVIKEVLAKHLGAPADGKPMPCFMCGKMLSPINGNWDYMQPDDGGEVRMIFAYGSRHDTRQCSGVVCDDCAQQAMKRMIVQDVPY